MPTPTLTRRQWLAGCGLGALALTTRCAGPTAALRAAEEALLAAEAQPDLDLVLWDREQPDPASVLRRVARPARRLGAERLARIDRRMRATLTKSGGVGLAAPQVGLSLQVVLVQGQTEPKAVLTCIDPRIVAASAETVDGYEACLSIPGVGGLVRRARTVDVAYYDLVGTARSRHAADWEARIFQHEIDHLHGILYLDRLVGELLPIDEMRRRRDAERRTSGHALAGVEFC